MRCCGGSSSDSRSTAIDAEIRDNNRNSIPKLKLLLLGPPLPAPALRHHPRLFFNILKTQIVLRELRCWERGACSKASRALLSTSCSCICPRPFFEQCFVSAFSDAPW